MWNFIVELKKVNKLPKGLCLEICLRIIIMEFHDETFLALILRDYLPGYGSANMFP